MKIVKLHLDDKLYYRIKQCNYSVNELIAMGIRLKQIFEIFEGKEHFVTAEELKQRCDKLTEVEKDEIIQ
jgi:hypothetical protein